MQADFSFYFDSIHDGCVDIEANEKKKKMQSTIWADERKSYWPDGQAAQAVYIEPHLSIWRQNSLAISI